MNAVQRIHIRGSFAVFVVEALAGKPPVVLVPGLGAWRGPPRLLVGPDLASGELLRVLARAELELRGVMN